MTLGELLGSVTESLTPFAHLQNENNKNTTLSRMLPELHSTIGRGLCKLKMARTNIRES